MTLATASDPSFTLLSVNITCDPTSSPPAGEGLSLPDPSPSPPSCVILAASDWQGLLQSLVLVQHLNATQRIVRVRS